MPLSSVHRPVPKKILANKVHEPETIQFMASNCGNGDIVHAGAYFGDFFPALSSAVSNEAKVWAFEPNAENFRCAEITIAINALKNIEFFNAGLGARTETLRLQTVDEKGKSLGGASKIIDSFQANINSEKTEILTVDGVVDSDRNVTVIQLDVEGYEKEALIGAEKTIRRCLPIIILEDWRKSNLIESEWFEKNIISLGYQQTERLHGNKVFQCK